MPVPIRRLVESLVGVACRQRVDRNPPVELPVVGARMNGVKPRIERPRDRAELRLRIHTWKRGQAPTRCPERCDDRDTRNEHRKRSVADRPGRRSFQGDHRTDGRADADSTHRCSRPRCRVTARASRSRWWCRAPCEGFVLARGAATDSEWSRGARGSDAHDPGLGGLAAAGAPKRRKPWLLGSAPSRRPGAVLC